MNLRNYRPGARLPSGGADRRGRMNHQRIAPSTCSRHCSRTEQGMAPALISPRRRAQLTPRRRCECDEGDCGTILCLGARRHPGASLDGKKRRKARRKRPRPIPGKTTHAGRIGRGKKRLSRGSPRYRHSHMSRSRSKRRGAGDAMSPSAAAAANCVNSNTRRGGDRRWPSRAFSLQRRNALIPRSMRLRRQGAQA
jgi:hypothetical protein